MNLSATNRISARLKSCCFTKLCKSIMHVCIPKANIALCWNIKLNTIRRNYFKFLIIILLKSIVFARKMIRYLQILAFKRIYFSCRSFPYLLWCLSTCLVAFLVSLNLLCSFILCFHPSLPPLFISHVLWERSPLFYSWLEPGFPSGKQSSISILMQEPRLVVWLFV